MIIYADSTALITLLAIEDGRQAVERELARAGCVVTSALSGVEMRRALRRAEEYGALSHDQYRGALAAFERDWRRLTVLDVSASIARVAGRIAGKSTRLSVARATHLASALATKTAVERVYAAANRDPGREKVETPSGAIAREASRRALRVQFLTCDPVLLSPARSEGLEVVYET